MAKKSTAPKLMTGDIVRIKTDYSDHTDSYLFIVMHVDGKFVAVLDSDIRQIHWFDISYFTKVM